MPRPTFSQTLAAKLLIATGLMFLVAGIAGASLAPKLPMRLVLLYAAIGTLVLLAVLVIGAVVTLTLAQFVLRKRGTDAQWLWFSAEPPGLVSLREQARDTQSPTTK